MAYRRLFSLFFRYSALRSLAKTQVIFSGLPLPYFFCHPSATGCFLSRSAYYATSCKPPPTPCLSPPISSTLTEPDIGMNDDQDNRENVVSNFLHLEELRLRTFVSAFGVGAAIMGCFAFSKELILLLEAPVKTQGVRFMQLAPGEFFFTSLKVSVYSGLLLGSPIILYQIVAFTLPLLTKSERRFLGPIVFGSSALFYSGIMFSYKIITPAALNFLASNAEGMVESAWSINRYCGFVLSLMFTTGLIFQVPVIQILLGQFGLVSGKRMLGMWRYVAVGCVVAAAALTPSPDAVTQLLLTASLLGLYLGGASLVKLSGH